MGLIASSTVYPAQMVEWTRLSTECKNYIFKKIDKDKYFQIQNMNMGQWHGVNIFVSESVISFGKKSISSWHLLICSTKPSLFTFSIYLNNKINILASQTLKISGGGKV